MFRPKWVNDALAFLRIRDCTHEMVVAIAEGEFAIDPKECPMHRLMKKITDDPQIAAKLRTAESNLQRISIIQENFPMEKFERGLELLDEKFRKRTTIAEYLERWAKEAEEEKHVKRALHNYNLATLFAPEHFAVGRIHLNRGKLLFIKKDYAKALHEALRALETNLEPYLKPEALQFKNQCLDKISEIENIDAVNANDTAEGFITYRDNVMYNTGAKKNRIYPVGDQGIGVKVDSVKGRYLVTDRKVHPGTPLIVEDPIVKVLIDQLQWQCKLCVYCGAGTKIVIPCPSCVFVSYCSRKCRKLDTMKCHKYECACLPFLHSVRATSSTLMAVRAILQEGPCRLYHRWIKSSVDPEVESSATTIPGVSVNTGIYDSKDFYALQHLDFNLTTCNVPELTWLAESFIKVLDFKTPFFQFSTQLRDENFKNYVASQLLHLFLAFSSNRISIQGRTCLDKNMFAECGFPKKSTTIYEPLHDIGFAVYPLATLISHSCDPNVFRYSLPNGKLVILSNRGLDPGDELCMSCGPSYLTKERLLRNCFMKPGSSMCNCKACIENWPLYKDLPKLKRSFLCEYCGITLEVCTSLDRVTTTHGVQISDIELQICRVCDRVKSTNSLMEKVRDITKKVQEGDELLRAGRPIEAIPIFVSSIVRLQSLMHLPNKEMADAHISLYLAYGMINRSVLLRSSIKMLKKLSS